MVFFFFREYIIPSPSGGFFAFFMVSLVFAALLQFLFFEALNLLSFWVENTYGIRFTMRVIMEVLGGALIPLSFFPMIMQKVFLLLPFQFFIFFPMRIYLGKIPINQIIMEFMREGVWIAGLAFLNWMIWKRGIRQYVAMGD